jgi:acetyl-CoA C-acetyltransferase
MGGLGGKVAIIGTGTIKFGENFRQSLSDPLNLFPIPVTRVAAYCATGIEAVCNAALAVASGEYDLVFVVGAEKMRGVPSRGSLVAEAVNRGHPVLAKGRTAPGMFALLGEGRQHSHELKHYGAWDAET